MYNNNDASKPNSGGPTRRARKFHEPVRDIIKRGTSLMLSFVLAAGITTISARGAYEPGDSSVVGSDATKEVFINADQAMLDYYGLSSLDELESALRAYINTQAVDSEGKPIYNTSNLKVVNNVTYVDATDTSDWFVYDTYDGQTATNGGTVWGTANYGESTTTGYVINRLTRDSKKSAITGIAADAGFYFTDKKFSNTTADTSKTGGTTVWGVSTAEDNKGRDSSWYMRPYFVTPVAQSAVPAPASVTDTTKKGYLKNLTTIERLYNSTYYPTTRTPLDQAGSLLKETGDNDNVRNVREHIWATSSGNNQTNVVFMGYYGSVVNNFMFYPATTDLTKTIEFDIDASNLRAHSMNGAGFLLNSGIDGKGYIHGYVLYITFSHPQSEGTGTDLAGSLSNNKSTASALMELYKINDNVSAKDFHSVTKGSGSNDRGIKYQNVMTRIAYATNSTDDGTINTTNPGWITSETTSEKDSTGTTKNGYVYNSDYFRTDTLQNNGLFNPLVHMKISFTNETLSVVTQKLHETTKEPVGAAKNVKWRLISATGAGAGQAIAETLGKPAGSSSYTITQTLSYGYVPKKDGNGREILMVGCNSGGTFGTDPKYYGFGPLVSFTTYSQNLNNGTHTCNKTSVFTFTNLSMYFETDPFKALMDHQFNTAPGADFFFINLISDKITDNVKGYKEAIAYLRQNEIYYITNQDNDVISHFAHDNAGNVIYQKYQDTNPSLPFYTAGADLAGKDFLVPWDDNPESAFYTEDQDKVGKPFVDEDGKNVKIPVIVMGTNKDNGLQVETNGATAAERLAQLVKQIGDYIIASHKWNDALEANKLSQPNAIFDIVGHDETMKDQYNGNDYYHNTIVTQVEKYMISSTPLTIGVHDLSTIYTPTVADILNTTPFSTIPTYSVWKQTHPEGTEAQYEDFVFAEYCALEGFSAATKEQFLKAVGYKDFIIDKIVIECYEPVELTGIPDTTAFLTKTYSVAEGTLSWDPVEKKYIIWEPEEDLDTGVVTYVATSTYDLYTLGAGAGQKEPIVGIYEIKLTAYSGALTPSSTKRQFTMIKDDVPPVVYVNDANKNTHGTFTGNVFEGTQIGGYILVDPVGWGVVAYQIITSDKELSAIEGDVDAWKGDATHIDRTMEYFTPDAAKETEDLVALKAKYVYVQAWDWVGNSGIKQIVLKPYRLKVATTSIYGFTVADQLTTAHGDAAWYQWDAIQTLAVSGSATTNNKYQLLGYSTDPTAAAQDSSIKFDDDPATGICFTKGADYGYITLYPIVKYIGKTIDPGLVVDVDTPEGESVPVITITTDPEYPDDNKGSSAIANVEYVFVKIEDPAVHETTDVSSGGAIKYFNDNTSHNVTGNEEVIPTKGLADGTYIVVVKVTDSDGNESYAHKVFSYAYVAAGEFTPIVSKSTVNWPVSNMEGKFGFKLYEGVFGDWVQIGSKKSNAANGAVAFDPIKYDLDDVGIHYYKIVESDITGEGNDGWTAASKVEFFSVSVADGDGEGVLACTANYGKDAEDEPYTGVSFTNTRLYGNAPLAALVYTRNAGASTNDIDITTAPTFTFGVYNGDTLLYSTANAANAVDLSNEAIKTAFESGVTTFIIKQLGADGGGWTLDKSIFTATIAPVETAASNGYDKLTFSVTYKKGEESRDSATFINEYAPTGVTASIAAGVAANVGFGAGQFEFTIVEKGEYSWNAVKEAANASASLTGAGVVAIANGITYDKPGTYIYKISQTDKSAENWTYDDSAFYAYVTVIDDRGTLKASVSYYTALGGEAEVSPENVVFVNTYSVPSPSPEESSPEEPSPEEPSPEEPSPEETSPVEPSSVEPSSLEPSSEEPSPEESSSEEPSSEEPSSEAPSSEEPSSEAPSSQAPSSQAAVESSFAAAPSYPQNPAPSAAGSPDGYVPVPITGSSAPAVSAVAPKASAAISAAPSANAPSTAAGGSVGPNAPAPAPDVPGKTELDEKFNDIGGIPDPNNVKDLDDLKKEYETMLDDPTLTPEEKADIQEKIDTINETEKIINNVTIGGNPATGSHEPADPNTPATVGGTGGTGGGTGGGNGGSGGTGGGGTGNVLVPGNPPGNNLPPENGTLTGHSSPGVTPGGGSGGLEGDPITNPDTITVNNVNNLIKDPAVITPEDKKVIDDGGKIDLELKIDTIKDLPADALDLVRSIPNTNGEVIGELLDMSIIKTALDKDGNPLYASDIDSFNESVRVALPIPDGSAMRVFVKVDGEWLELDNMDLAVGTFVFDTNFLGEILIVYEKMALGMVTFDTTGKENPKTGDSCAREVAAGLGIAIGLFAISLERIYGHHIRKAKSPDDTEE